jgi:hypothetical protein
MRHECMISKVPVKFAASIKVTGVILRVGNKRRIEVHPDNGLK